MKTTLTLALAPLMLLTAPLAMAGRRNEDLRRTDPEFYTTPEARRIGDQVLLYQRDTGGWPKNIDMAVPLTQAQADSVAALKCRQDDSTTDNNATILQLQYLARLYRATACDAYRDGFVKGIEYLLSGQYPGGGWPQFWPQMRDYQIHITFNDNAMVGTLTVLRDLMNSSDPYDAPGLIDPAMRRRLLGAYYKGIECILATQIRDSQGRRTVWCQQHDRETLAPAKARAYELPSYCSAESVGIVALLMSVPAPDARIKDAVHSAMAWLDAHKITGYRYRRVNERGEPDTRLIADPSAPALWARFYDLDNARPFVCDRDGVPRERLEDIGFERRNGYGWYNDGPSWLYTPYREWCQKHGEKPVV